MIIWGSTGREKELASGQFHCPQCDSQQVYQHIRYSRYFTLYFIPLFPMENLGEGIKCQSCHQLYKVEVLDYKPPTDAERLLMSVRADLESGTPLQMAQRKLINAGVSEETADIVVTAAAGDGRKPCTKCELTFMSTVSRCSNCGQLL